jgi:F0F1-type ATP synthase membrane subunit c/vacuolar-type H+-ATPase subunit K
MFGKAFQTGAAGDVCTVAVQKDGFLFYAMSETVGIFVKVFASLW